MPHAKRVRSFGGEIAEGEPARGERLRNFCEATVVAASKVPELLERLVHIDVAAFGEHALCLLDRDAAVQCVLQPVFAQRGVASGLVLDDRDAARIVLSRAEAAGVPAAA